MSLRLCVHMRRGSLAPSCAGWQASWKKKTARRVCIIWAYIEVILVSARAKDFFTLNSWGPEHQQPESQPRYLLCSGWWSRSTKHISSSTRTLSRTSLNKIFFTVHTLVWERSMEPEQQLADEIICGEYYFGGGSPLTSTHVSVSERSKLCSIKMPKKFNLIYLLTRL